MANLKIHFAIPWLLLIIIPAVVLALWPHLRIAKRYRRTRNRIISLTLHICILVLGIVTFAGLMFTYDVPNKENEVLLLVDVSESNSGSMEAKNEFVKAVLDESGARFKVGVVTFGFDCRYVAPLSDNPAGVYTNYLNSFRVAHSADTSATNIEGALDYVMKNELFLSPKTAKIILISDGVETDGNAASAVRKAASRGIRIDTVCFPNAEESDVRLVQVNVPDYNVIAGDKFSFELTVVSSVSADADVKIIENGALKRTEQVALGKGSNNFSIDHVFDLPGIYKLEFEISLREEAGATDADTVKENNTYCTYMNLQVFNKVLMLESFDGEADELHYLLSEDADYGQFDVTVINVKQSPEQVPADLDALREYDQVILVNISNNDLVKTEGMPAGFDVLLNRYVEEVGGGVFAIGGSEPGSGGGSVTQRQEAHAFDIEDMAGAGAYAELLPVRAVDYTPPLGVVIIVDRSNSMTNIVSDKQTRLDIAKMAARNCLNALTYRDYVGIMSLDDSYSVNQTPRNVVQSRGEIEAIIDSIVSGDATRFRGAISRAGDLLVGLGDLVERKHIILVTDGLPEDDISEYGIAIQKNLENGITFSTMVISSDSDVTTIMDEAARMGGGRSYSYSNQEAGNIISEMRKDLKVSSITQIEYSSYQPTVRSHNSVMLRVDEANLPYLHGFYGTQAKAEAEVILQAPYHVPLYVQMQHGQGRSGAFLCSLDGGAWSRDFLNDDNGKRILYNIVNALMPTRDIRACDVSASIVENNYTTDISIYTTLKEGERVQVTVTDYMTNTIVSATQAPNASQGYSMARYTIKNPGLYRIVVQKTDAAGSPVVNGRYETFKTFSYSQEYSLYLDEEASKLVMAELASAGNGELITDAADVFSLLETVVHRQYDPRILFISLIIVMFLLDIAVRKFKFKWPHELVRDLREKKRMG